MTGMKTQNEQDTELLKLAFRDNEPSLKLLRSLFFGFELSEDEKNTIKVSFANPQLREAIRKKTYPIISKDVPVGHEADFWSGMESQIFGHDQHSIRQAVESKQMVLNMFERAFSLLADPFGTPIDFSYSSDSLLLDPLQVKLLARNLYFKTISVALATIKILAEQKDNETPQQAAARLNADSSK